MGNKDKNSIRRDLYVSPNHKKTNKGFYNPTEPQSSPGNIHPLALILVAVVITTLYLISLVI